MLGGSMGAQLGWPYGMHPRRLLVFGLGGKATLPQTPAPMMVTPLDDPSFKIDPQLADAGEERWSKTCSWCHGPGAVAAGGAPDLRASAIVLDQAALTRVVVDGERVARGMPRYAEFSADDIQAIQHFVRKKARLALTGAGVAATQ
jgi:quinohemoprotein ethanol dehydrogenase